MWQLWEVVCAKEFLHTQEKVLLKTQNISENTSEVERMEEVLKHGVKDDIYDVMSKDSLILNFGKELCILAWYVAQKAM